MNEIDALASLVGVFAVYVCRTASKLTPKRKAQMLFLLIATNASVATLMAEKEDEERKRRELIHSAVESVYTEFWSKNRKKRSTTTGDEGQEITTSNKKRRPTKHDHERAWQCIQQDYLGPEPIFTDKQFEEVYRLTKRKVNQLIDECCRHRPDCFGRDIKDATGKSGIRVECKVLGILKCVAFGCSGVAFRDYHQMAGNTFTVNLKAFFDAITRDDYLKGTYLRSPNKCDAMSVCELHRKKHNVEGLLGCIDCYHWMWKNCPVAQQCHYKNGKNKMSSVVLEAMVDHNTWFWHASFGHAGTNNDINIWDVSELQSDFMSSYFHEVIDFPFAMDSERFDRLWCLVDGIYPPLNRFVKTISQPVGETMERFVGWQESARKDVERAFGILVRKFQILSRPCEYWYVDDMKSIMYGCIIMHNMMVEDRLDRDEAECADMYAVEMNSEDDPAEREATLERVVSDNTGLRPPEDKIDSQYETQLKRWEALYDEREHIRLQTAVMNHLVQQYISHQENKFD